jgi:hypothetical protein
LGSEDGDDMAAVVIFDEWWEGEIIENYNLIFVYY